MLSRTRGNLVGSYNVLRRGGARPHVGQLPYYVHEVPGNPYAFFNHDGQTTEFMKGFTPKKVGWLQRFRHNMNPRCTAVGAFAFNIWGKNVHWLENKTSTKVYQQMISDECYPHSVLWISVVVVTVLHLGRYLYGHPDVSLFNASMWATKPLVDACRWEKPYTMDRPVFRLFQGISEFYAYNPYRDLVRVGAVANDPWLEYLKETDQLENAKKLPEEYNGPDMWPRPKPAPAHH
eukprot:PhM_4_TR13366/c2_g1_i2/m.64898